MSEAKARQRSLLADLETAAAETDSTTPVVRDGVAVRETHCKSILNKSSLGGYSLNCYTGCAHACAYCYARFMQRFHPHPEAWGEFVDVKTNAVEVLRRQLRRTRPGEVFVSSACDGWQPMEEEWRLTRECCRLLLEHGFTVSVLTKSPLVLRDLDVLTEGSARVGVTLVTLSESLRGLWEPRAGAVRERLRILTEAREAGLPTNVMCGPLLPFISDSRASIETLFAELRDRGVGRIWLDALNRRPRVWEAVQDLLRREFPDLLPSYRAVLFDAEAREEYLALLRTRVGKAAEKAGVADRVAGCV